MKRLAVDLVILNERPASYLQDLQGALEALVRASHSRTPDAGDGTPGAVFVLRSDLVSDEARGCTAQRRAGGTAQPAREPVGAGEAARGRRRSPPRPGRLRRPEPAVEPLPQRRELEFFNGLGGFSDGWARVRHRSRRGPMDARAVDQRDRESRLRLPGLRRGLRLHLGGEQPREPDHAVVQRSRDRSAGRSVLRSRRRLRRAVGPDGVADSRRDRTLRRATRPGLQPLRAHGPRRRARAAAVRGARRRDQDLAPLAPESLRRARVASR